MLKRKKGVLNKDKVRKTIDNIGFWSLIIAIIAINSVVWVTKKFHSMFLFWLLLSIAGVGVAIGLATRLWYFKDQLIEFKNNYYAKYFEEMEELKRQKRHEKIKKH